MAAVSDRAPKLRRTGESLPKYAQKERGAFHKMVRQTVMALLAKPSPDKHPIYCSQEDRPEAAQTGSPLLARKLSYIDSQPIEEQHQGARPYQEDKVLKPVEITFQMRGEETKATLFGLFDGHGEEGRCATLVRERLPGCLARLLNDRFKEGLTEEAAVGDAFTQAFHELAKEYAKPEYRQQVEVRGQKMFTCGGGTTACCGLRLGNRVYFANVGDSRAVLLKNQTSLQMTEDADIDNSRFSRWHKKHHNWIGMVRGVWRVAEQETGGVQMGLARAVGSHRWMCCKPKISFLTLGSGDDDVRHGEIFAKDRDVLIFMSDGVTGRFTNGGLRDRFFANKRKGMNDQQNLKDIAEAAGLPAGSDNSSLLLVPIRSQWLAPKE